ncbi:MAG: hypothetical protein IPI09_20595 [Burkholderiales bacterium]|nr:hypothetical protein [Burkholderiales bacterium]
MYHSLALKSDGTVVAWGNNLQGQLGDGTTTNRTSPVAVTGLTAVAAIAAAGYQSIALKSDGTVVAWGLNNEGQLGDVHKHQPQQSGRGDRLDRSSRCCGCRSS